MGQYTKSGRIGGAVHSVWKEGRGAVHEVWKEGGWAVHKVYKTGKGDRIKI